MPASLDRLFRPRSVTLIGASTDPAKIGGRPLHFLQRHGFTGDIWPVNPRAAEISGLECYPDTDSLPGVPDVAMVLVGPAHAEASVRTLAAMGTGAAVVLAGGFAETGDAGAARQAALVAAAGNMRLLGPNTIGLMNMTDGITLSASGALDIEDRFRGGVAIVSQSGGILGSLLSRASARGVGLSQLVATGNEADIDVSDAVDWLADDPATRVIALYLETLRHPDRFRAAARKAAGRGMRLVAYKVGRSEAGARSAASHTGALAGEDRFFDALFAQLGVIRASNFEDLVDVPAALAAVPRVAGRRLAILTTTGGAAGLVADVCGVAGFDTPAPGANTAKMLAALMQNDGYMPDRNPIDLTLAGLDSEIIFRAVTLLAECGDYDAVIPVIGSSAVGRPNLAADPITRAVASAKRPVIVYVSPDAPGIVQRLNASGVPAFRTPEACAAALAALAQSPPPATGPAQPPATVPAPFDGRTGALNEADAKALFAAFGIAAVREISAVSPEDAARAAAAFTGPLVVKLLSAEVSHKSEIGGVRVGVAPRDAVDVCREIEEAAHAAGIDAPDGFLLQEQVTGGIEIIVGLARDPLLGPALLLGAGGAATELYNDTALRLLPVGREDVEEMIDSLRIAPVLRGYRGATPADVGALIDAALGFAAMCEAFGDRLLDAEINPLFVLPAGEGVKAADGIAVLAD